MTIHIANGALDTMGSSMCHTHGSISRTKSLAVGSHRLVAAPVTSRTLSM
jgi:hypothetical protein